MNTMRGLGAVARTLGVQRHRITYALESGYVDEPARMEGRRAFAEKDIEQLRTYFQKREERKAERRTNAG